MTAQETGLTPEQHNELIDRIHECAGVLDDNFDYLRSQPHADTIRDLSLDYPDSALTALYEYLMLDLSANEEQYESRKSFLAKFHVINFNSTPTTVHEYLTFKPAMPLTTGSSPTDGIMMISALRDYDQLPTMDNYADSSEETKRQVTALLTVTDALFTRYKEHEAQAIQAAASARGISTTFFPVAPPPTTFGLPLQNKPHIRLLGNNLINLIIEKPDNANDISCIILSEGITDSNLIRAMLTSEAPALRNGLI